MTARKAQPETVPVNSAEVGDSVHFIALLAAGARFYGEMRGELEAFCQWRDMRFELVDAEKEFYRRFE